jgi:hypothetical protein
MKTKLLIALITCTFVVGCAGTDYNVGVNYYGRSAATVSHSFPIPIVCDRPQPVPYIIDRPILPAGFPCAERVPSYSVARPVYGGRSVMMIDNFN